MSAFMGTAYDDNRNIVRAGRQVAANGTLDVVLPLLGTPLDSSCCDKHVPIGALSDVTLELYLASANEPRMTQSSAPLQATGVSPKSN